MKSLHERGPELWVPSIHVKCWLWQCVPVSWHWGASWGLLATSLTKWMSSRFSGVIFLQNIRWSVTEEDTRHQPSSLWTPHMHTRTQEHTCIGTYTHIPTHVERNIYKNIHRNIHTNVHMHRERGERDFQTEGHKRNLITNYMLVRMNIPGITGEIQLWINVLTSPREA